MPFWQTPGSGQTLHDADADRAERDGPAGSDHRVREHRGARPRTRGVAARRNRAAAGARRDAGAESSGCWLSRTSCSRCPARVLGILLAQRASRSLSRYAERLAAPQRIFFNIEVDGLVIGFAALVACGQRARIRIRPGAAELARRSGLGHQRGRLAPRRGARAIARQSRRRASRGLAPAAGRRRTGDAKCRRGATCVSRLRREPRDGDRAGRQAERYDEARGRVFYRKLLDAARADAGVESATLAAYPPLGLLDTRMQRVSIEGYEPRQGEDLAFMWNAVGLGLLPHAADQRHGRTRVRRQDDETAAPVAVVNATLAQRFWGGAVERDRQADPRRRTASGGR